MKRKTEPAHEDDRKCRKRAIAERDRIPYAAGLDAVDVTRNDVCDEAGDYESARQAPIAGEGAHDDRNVEQDRGSERPRRKEVDRKRADQSGNTECSQ